MKKFIVIVITSFLGIGILIFFAVQKDKKLVEYKAMPNTENLAPLGELFDDQGQIHIKPKEEHPVYNSNPPTSGWHWVNPASWGIYSEKLVDEQAIHNLEHGGIWISYKDTDEETILALEKIAKANSRSVILSPREENDAKIVLASWRRLEKMNEYNESKILEFISRNKNNSPEPFAK